MKKIILATMFVLASVFSLVERSSAYSAYLVDEPAVSIDNSYVLDVKANNITYATAVADYDDGTPAAKTFTDGQVSTGSITVKTLSAMTTAYATDTITVLSTSNISKAIIALPGYTLREGTDWRVGASTSATAANIATALGRIPWLTVTRDYAVITITAKVPGSYYNLIPVSSKNSNITVATPYMTGGQDNAVVTINGIDLRHNLNWYAGASSATAAVSLAAAINGNTALAAVLTATANSPTSGIVALASDAVGLSKNFSLASSTPAALVVSGTAMTGGENSAYTTGSSLINIPSHGFNMGLPVLYTEGAAAMAPLVDQTTYFISVVDGNTVKLATTSARAVLGLGVTITATPAPTNTYTLTPTPIAGSDPSSFKWEVSTNNVDWSDMAVDSVTISDFGTLPLSKSWDLDTSKDYIRLSLVAPTAGALELKVLVNGIPLSEFARTSGDSFTGRVNMLNAPLVLSGASGTVTSAAKITGAGVESTGYTKSGSKTLAQMNAYTPGAAGEVWFISDATLMKHCTSTGTAAGAFTTFTSTFTHCQ